MAELKLTYGKDSEGRLVHIKDVPGGLACNCVCPSCGEKIEACKGNVRTHYFRHYSTKECEGAFESQLHLLSKHIIEQNKAVMLPSYKGKYDTDDARQIQFTEVLLECAQDDLQPDCLCKYVDTNNNEHTLWIEILNTHEVDETKAQKIKERGIECVEIDVSHLFANSNVIEEELLADFLLKQSDHREWKNNPAFDAEDEKKREVFIQNLKNEIITESQYSLNFDQKLYPDYIIEIRNQLYYIADFWMNNGTKESAESVINQIYNPYQDRDYVINIEECLVPNKDYLAFLVKAPKNPYTLKVFYAILDYDSRASINTPKTNITMMETLLNELREVSNLSAEDEILLQGIEMYRNFPYQSAINKCGNAGSDPNNEDELY